MEEKCYKTKVTNPIIARIVFEIFLKTNQFVTSEAVQQYMLADSRWIQYVKNTLSCFIRRDNEKTWSIEDVPAKYYAHFGQLFFKREYCLYFDREGNDPYLYRPKESKIEELRSIFFEGELNDRRISGKGLQQEEFPVFFGIDAEPTADIAVLEQRVENILKKKIPNPPVGQEKPKKVVLTSENIAYERNPLVHAWVLQQAQGVCDLCNSSAPFITIRGTPYLEVHHVIPLAEGGPDIIENTVAVCPNCHRELHYSIDANKQRQLLREKVKRLIFSMVIKP